MAVTTVTVPLDSGAAKPAESEQPVNSNTEAAAEKPEGGEGEQPVAPGELTKETPKGETEGAPEGEKAEGGEGVVKTEEQLKAEKAVGGLDLTAISEEFARDGKFSETTYTTLEERGIPRELADTYALGLQARVTERLNDLATAVGGVDNYNGLLGWAKDALSEKEKANTVKLLSEGDPDAAKTFLRGLQARRVEAQGKSPSKKSSGSGNVPEDTFKSRAEQAKAMADPRYKANNADGAKYRDEVMKKSIRSFGTASRKRVKSASPKNSRRARSGKR